MSNLLEKLIRQETKDPNVVGILVFGSFVKGKVRETSDLDLLVVREDIEVWSHMREREEGIPLEVHTWPLKIFSRPFRGEQGGLSDVFIFGVMRSGRILYDPKGILEQFKRCAQTHRLPASYMKSLAERACKNLRLARNLLEMTQTEGAELEVRKAAEEGARALLLERDVTEIIPPRDYLPHLRSEIPDFYSTFREVHNLQKIRGEEVEAAVQEISEWRNNIVEEIRRTGKEDWLKPGGAIHGAESELSNAQDCLENGDLEAAMLQARYSAILIMSPLLRLLGTSAKTLGMRYMEIVRSGHPYGDIVKSVMSFSRDEQGLTKHIEILVDLVERLG